MNALQGYNYIRSVLIGLKIDPVTLKPDSANAHSNSFDFSFPIVTPDFTPTLTNVTDIIAAFNTAQGWNARCEFDWLANAVQVKFRYYTPDENSCTESD